MYFTRLTLMVFITLSVTYTKGQIFTQTIKGRIVDQQSKTPVIGASIVIEGTDPVQGAVTDLEGYFKIPGVVVGRHQIMISSVGYEGKTIPNVQVTTGKEVVLEIELIEALVEMEAVQVVASQKEKGQVPEGLRRQPMVSLCHIANNINHSP